MPLLFSLLLLCAAAAVAPLAAANSPVASADRNGGYDHRAHAVPGGPYILYDHSGSDSAIVPMNGERSHTHYYDAVRNVRGTLVKYVWTLERTELYSGSTTRFSPPRFLCSSVNCAPSLRVGQHFVRLTVTDSTGDVASATTRVRIIEGGRPGARLFFYRGNLDIAVHDDWKTSNPRPDLSRTPAKVNLWAPSSFPSNVLSKDLSIRAVFELDIDEPGRYSLRIDCGNSRCWASLGNVMLLPWGSGARSRKKTLTVGSYPVEILWRRKYDAQNKGSGARLVLQWIRPRSIGTGHGVIPAEEIAHRPGNMPPVIHFVLPENPVVDTTLKLYGSGFVLGTRVFIGDSECRGATPIGQFFLTCEVSGSAGLKAVTANNGIGVSNANNIISVQGGERGVGYVQDINFKQGIIKDGNRNWKISSATSVVLGPDNRFYFSTQWGALVTATIVKNRMQDACASKQLDDRSILGLAFNPHDGGALKLYATVCTLFWEAKNRLPVKSGWRNGEVWIFTPRGDGSDCLNPSKKIVSGIPVSNFDHGVNKIEFDDYGFMYVSVGSNTNGGVPSKEFGRVLDTRLSGAILSFPIAKKNFNGNIKWDRDDDISKAKVISGDVSAFATGTRNCFGLSYHSSGRLYGTDNGGNQAFGPRSTGCNSDARPRNEDDKVLLLKKGAWYGAANRARGLHGGDPRQCVHKRPGIDTSGYELPLALTEPATTGIIEYTANTFGARLRGNLLLSQLATSKSSGRLYRARVDATSGKINNMYTMTKWSGLAMAIGPWGDLIMPRVYKQQVAILEAQEKDPGIVVVTKLNPYRGPKRGGHGVFVTGWNFGRNADKISVEFVGVGKCTNVRNVAANGRSLQCTVPKLDGVGPRKVPVLVTVGGMGASKSAGFEYWYMSI